MSRFTEEKVWTSDWGSDRGTIAEIGQEVSGGVVLVHRLAVRVRHAMVRLVVIIILVVCRGGYRRYRTRN